MSHSIRLAGPWQVEPLAGLVFPEGDAESRRVKLPAGWSELFGEVAGEARFVRAFNAPTGIEGTRLFLVFEQLQACVTLSLNGQVLAEHAEPVNDLRVEITERIERGNRLELVLKCSPIAGKVCGLHRPARLVIEE